MLSILDFSKMVKVGCTSKKAGDGFLLTISPGRSYMYSNQALPWNDFEYIVIDAKNLENWTIGLALVFWKKGNDVCSDPDFIVVMGLVPMLDTRLCFKLSYFDSQTIFLPRTPGRLKCIVLGNRIDRNEIGAWGISLQPNGNYQRILIKNFYLSREEPEYPVPNVKLIDKMGQYKKRDWPGKTKSVSEMISFLRMERMNAQKVRQYREFSHYGGWKKLRFEGSGFFRRHFDGKRWWLVDPDGYAFFSVGIASTTPSIDCYIRGIEKLYEGLPKNWDKKRDFYDYGVANLVRAFGDEWFDAWVEITKSRYLKFAVNTVGCYSEKEFWQRARLPYTCFADPIPSTKNKIFRDFPDVFSHEYYENAMKYREMLEITKNDPYLIGYYIDNEPKWSFASELNIASETLASENNLATRDTLVEFLKQRYENNISKLNTAWNTLFKSFSDFSKPIRNAEKFSKMSKKDLEDFSRIIIRRLIEVPVKACRSIDPNHMILGIRLPFIANPMFLEGSDLFDVFTINCYQASPCEYIKKFTEFYDMPVLIGEMHFGAIDRGLSATGLCGVKTQKDRTRAYKYYYENGAADPHCVGIHYFQLNDQPYLGRHDGENFQIGVVDICHKPYYEFCKGMTETNRHIYEVVSGMRLPCNIPSKKIFRIGF